MSVRLRSQQPVHVLTMNGATRQKVLLRHLPSLVFVQFESRPCLFLKSELQRDAIDRPFTRSFCDLLFNALLHLNRPLVDGITVPYHCCMRLRNGREQPWEEVTGISFVQRHAPLLRELDGSVEHLMPTHFFRPDGGSDPAHILLVVDITGN